MAASGTLTFAFQDSVATDRPKPCQELYAEVIEDCRLGYNLGYEYPGTHHETEG